MKKLFMILIILSACKKESTVEPITDHSVIGVWSIVPTGQPLDTYSYQTGNSESLYFSYVNGQVNTPPISIQIKANSIYRIYYTDTTVNTLSVQRFGNNTAFYIRTDTLINSPDTNIVRSYHVQITHQTRSYAVNFIDSLPATIF